MQHILAFRCSWRWRNLCIGSDCSSFLCPDLIGCLKLFSNAVAISVTTFVSATFISLCHSCRDDESLDALLVIIAASVCGCKKEEGEVKDLLQNDVMIDVVEAIFHHSLSRCVSVLFLD